MSNGGYKGSTPARETSPEQYPGVWELTEQFQAQADGNWPFQETDCAPKSLRFDGSSSPSDSLSRTPPIESDRRTWSWSAWIKRGKVSSEACIFTAGANTANTIRFNSNDTLKVNAGSDGSVETVAVFRDPSAWFHLLVTLQTGAVTDSDRLKIYVNNVLQTVSGTYPTKDSQGSYNAASVHYVGRQVHNEGNRFDGCIADLQFIDGQALTPDAFTFIDGQGIIQPKRFTGDYGLKTVTFTGVTTGGAQYNGPYSNVFDGNPASRVLTYTSTSTKLTLDSPPAWTNKIEIRALRYGGVFEINGVDISGLAWTAAAQYLDATSLLGSSGTLQTIEVGDVGSNYVALYSIKLDGVELIQPTSGGNNSFHLDFSDEVKDQSGLGNDWTANNISSPKGYIAGISINAPANVTLQSAEHHKMFNGSKDDYCYAHTNDATNFIQWTPTGGYPTDGHIWIQGGDGNGGGADGMTVEINGAAVSRSAVVDNEAYSSGSYGWGDWHKYAVAGNTLNSLKLTGVYALIRQLSTVADPTHSALGISDDNDVPAIVDTFPSTQDYFIDSPVNGNQTDPSGLGGIVQGNYPTWNPLSTTTSTFSDGNLKLTTGSGVPTDFVNFYTPAGIGKWYWEFEISALGGTNYTMIGMLPSDTTYVQGSSQTMHLAGGISYYAANGGINAATGAATTGTAGATYDIGDVIGWAFDAENGTLQCYKNGTSQGTQFTNIRTDVGWVFCAHDYMNYSGSVYVINFGQRAFKHPLAGYKSLCTSNLPEPSIPVPSQYFDTKLWTGNSSTQTISGYGFSPDFAWIKVRSEAARSHFLFDTIRGATNVLKSDAPDVEQAYSTSLTAFNSDGFDLGAWANVNNSTKTIVGWAWDAGEATTTIAAGSLNSSAYDQSQTWSSGTFSPAASDTGTETRAFNGQLGAQGGYFNGGGTWTPSSAITFYNQVEIYDSVDQKYAINGGTQVAINIGSWTTIASTTAANGATLNTINFTRISDAATTHTWQKLRIDGKELVDYGVTPPNVPSIASTVRSSPESGFSIVTYTGGSSTPANSDSGDSFGHGLGASPKLVICKKRTGGNSWPVYHASTALGALVLDGDNAIDTASYLFAQKHPTSSVVYLGNNPEINNSSDNYVAYCFAPVEGYSAFGSYVGNGGSSGNGPFVYTGFKTRWVMMKVASPNHAGSWVMYDTTRDTASSGEGWLYANSTSSEQAAATYAVHTTSNGFRLAGTSNENNGSGRTYIYAAFAESPFKNARAR